MELLKNPSQKAEFLKAQKHHQRLRLHCTPVEDKNEVAHKDFFKWVASFLKKKDKQTFFKALYAPPLPTNAFVSDLFKELSRLFDAKNKNIEYNFVDLETEAEFVKYLDELDYRTSFSASGIVFDYLKTGVNSVAVVDSKTNTETAEPYFHFVNPGQFLYIEEDVNGNLSRFAWKDRKETRGNVKYEIACWVDEYQYILFEKKEGTDEWVLSESFPKDHLLKSCPAVHIIRTASDRNNKLIKEGPLNNVLGYLDWLLYYEVAKRCVDTYASFPIISMYKQQCNYTDPKTNIQCNGSGTLQGTNKEGENITSDCPNCTKASGLIGPGTVIKQKAPIDGRADLKQGIYFVSPNTDSLKYCESQIEKLKKEISTYVIGSQPDLGAAAMNEKRVIAAFESRQNVTQHYAEVLARLDKSISDLLARARYGDLFKSSTVNYGSIFYLYSVEQALQNYVLAKKSGLPEFELNMKRQFAYETEYKNDPIALRKATLLSQIEPFLNYTLEEADGIASSLELYVKTNFSSLVARFESENGSIAEFGLGKQTEAYIVNQIKSKIYEYAIHDRRAVQEDSGSAGEDGPTPD